MLDEADDADDAFVICKRQELDSRVAQSSYTNSLTCWFLTVS